MIDYFIFARSKKKMHFAKISIRGSVKSRYFIFRESFSAFFTNLVLISFIKIRLVFVVDKNYKVAEVGNYFYQLQKKRKFRKKTREEKTKKILLFFPEVNFRK